MQEKLIALKNEALAQIISCASLSELEQIRIDYLGKSGGKLTLIMKAIPDMTPEEKGIVGRFANEAKETIEEAIKSQVALLSTKRQSESREEVIDPTVLGPIPLQGHLHPTTIVFRKMNEIFKSMGFAVAEGPEIESDDYNYNRLNLPPDHPARDLQDTLYIEEPNLLLRTHTSSIEAHILATEKPPYRFVMPGKAYRFENVNASNNIMFTQYQGLAIGEGITISHLKGTLLSFIKQFFGQNRAVRFRCKYYPEVEPGVGVDLDCPFCHQKGCPVCKYRGWIEMLGAGMVHPQMLRLVGLDPDKLSGFAWGMGSDRIVMDHFGINDVRALYNGEIGYLE